MSNWLSWIGRSFSLKDRGAWSSIGARGTWAGEPVNADIAMQLSAVWRAVRLTATTMASLPFGLIAADGSGATPMNVAIDSVIRKSPNDQQTALEFWEAIIGAQELAGNAFAHKSFSGTGPRKEVTSLHIMNPWATRLDRTPSGAKRWLYTNDRGYQFEYDDEEVFHLKNFSFDGELGLSTVSSGAQTISSARAGNRVAGTMFKSGLSASGFIETNQVLQEPDRKRLQGIVDEYVGAGNAGRVMMLEGGMTFKPMSLSAVDAQLLTSRKFEIEEIGRWFDIPPVLLGHAQEGQTNWGTGVESVIRSWYVLGLRNRIRRVQEAVSKRLLNAEQRTLWTPKYNVGGLLQGDSVQQMGVLVQAVNNSLMNPDEARGKLDMPALPNGEGQVFRAPVNLAPLAQLGDNGSNDSAQLRALVRRYLGIEDAPVAPPQIEHTDSR